MGQGEGLFRRLPSRQTQYPFYQGLDLPGLAGTIRLLSLILTGVLAAVVVEMAYSPLDSRPEIPVKAVALALYPLCAFWESTEEYHRSWSSME